MRGRERILASPTTWIVDTSERAVYVTANLNRISGKHMLLRVCLILAIVAGLAVTGVTWFMVRPQVQQIVTDRDFNKTKWTEFEGKFNSSQRELKTTQETLRKTEG